MTIIFILLMIGSAFMAGYCAQRLRQLNLMGKLLEGLETDDPQFAGKIAIIHEVINHKII